MIEHLRRHHPLDIKPLGNLLIDLEKKKHNSDIKNDTDNETIYIAKKGIFGLLDDEIILEIITLLDSKDLLILGQTCRFFYAFTRFDNLWRNIVIDNKIKFDKWYGTWLSTYFQKDLKLISCSGVYSDVLYRPFQCSNINYDSYYIKSRLPHLNIPKLKNMSLIDFESKYYKSPFILEKNSDSISALSIDDLKVSYGNTIFRAESVDWSFSLYYQYLKNNFDESPLYLFDKKFLNENNLFSKYPIQEIFKNDLFKVMDDLRPDYRWLIIGPENSASSFHKDPNSTSAWNQVLSGLKYWIFFPPDISPPGVYVSADESEVTSPLSVAEWFLNFYQEALHTPGFMDGICRSGETVYVPSGWWHLVVNIETSVAITQNFVPNGQLKAVLDFLKNKPDQISGFPKSISCDNSNSIRVYDIFIERLRNSEYKDLAESTLEQLDITNKNQFWTKLRQENDKEFSFNFL